MNNTGWQKSRSIGKNGTGNWAAFDIGLEKVFNAAAIWKKELSGIDKPWLCWAVDENWCALQQKLVLAVGWTPIVGWDPNCFKGVPNVVAGSRLLDFNKELQLEVLWCHFPLEFVFLWTRKLAFWHSDVLLPVVEMKKYASEFERLKNVETMAVKSTGGRRHFFNKKRHRYWEVLGCTSQLASLDQFENGCGWWRNIWAHPNCTSETEKKLRKKYYYEHGVGIMYWKRRYNGQVRDIDIADVSKYHYSETAIANYRKSISKSDELSINFDLYSISRDLGIQHLLAD